jgi:hypothetical protein
MLKVNAVFSGAMSLLAVAWALLGLAGFVYSIFCFGKTPSVLRAIGGIAISIFLGPLFWIYYFADKQYCRS